MNEIIIQFIKKNKFILLIILFGFLLYGNSLSNKFVWDDEEQIVNNTAIHSLENIPSFFGGSTFNPGGRDRLGGVYYRPLMIIYFSLIYAASKTDPFLYHLFQVTFHLANTILVYLIFSHLLTNKLFTHKQGKTLLPFFLSLVFLTHPVNVESVAYISAIQEVLFFFFGALALYLVMREKDNHFGVFKVIRLILIACLLFLSLSAKETGFAFILMIIVYSFLFERKHLLTNLILTLIPLGLYLFVRIRSAGMYLPKWEIPPISRLSFFERMINAPQITLYYLKAFFLPKDLAICQHWTVDSLTLKEFFFPLFLLLIFFTFLIGFGIKLYRQRSKAFWVYLLFFLLFCLGLGPHLQIIALDMTVAERWAYLPIVGLLGMIGVAIEVIPSLVRRWLRKQLHLQKKLYQNSLFCSLRRNSNLLKLGLALVIVVILSFRTIVRNFNWKDGLTLYSHDVNISKDSFDLENNLGVELFRIENYDEAKVHFEKSIELAPDWWTNWNNLGVIHGREGNLHKAEEHYKKAIENGNYYLAYENYAEILILQNRNEEAKEFLEKEALPRFPYNEKLQVFYLFLIQAEQSGPSS